MLILSRSCCLRCAGPRASYVDMTRPFSRLNGSPRDYAAKSIGPNGNRRPPPRRRRNRAIEWETEDELSKGECHYASKEAFREATFAKPGKVLPRGAGLNVEHLYPLVNLHESMGRSASSLHFERWASGYEGASTRLARSWHAPAARQTLLWVVRCSFCRVLAISADRRSLRCHGAPTAAAEERRHLHGVRKPGGI